MSDDSDKKDFVDPTVAGSVIWFSFKAVAQSIIGWIGLSFFKELVRKWRGNGATEEVSGQEQDKKD